MLSLNPLQAKRMMMMMMSVVADSNLNQDVFC